MAKQNHVVLQQDVANLGKSGDLVRVRAGYARNFLMPRGLAAPATAGNVARIEALRKQAVVRAAKELEGAQESAKKLESLSVKIARAVGEENRMYGSVTAKDVEDAFRAIGVEIDRKKIILVDPIKTLGLAEVPIKLHHDVVAKLRVEVVKGQA
jgi:large subunit ribosomal protein L9